MPRPTRLTDDELTSALAALPGWTRDGDTIVKTYEMSSFLAVIELVGQIAERAEAADHHPDLDIRYRRLRVALSTHDAGGLTALDVTLAGEIEALAEAAGVISAIVAIAVFGLVISVVIAYARDPGPTPTDIAVAYELAWDRLDFGTLWTLSGSELRDGFDQRTYVSAKQLAYSGRTELRDLAAQVEIVESTVGIGHAVVRTNVTLRDGAQVRNDIVLTKRSAAWVVTGYQLVPNPPQPA